MQLAIWSQVLYSRYYCQINRKVDDQPAAVSRIPSVARMTRRQGGNHSHVTVNSRLSLHIFVSTITRQYLATRSFAREVFERAENESELSTKLKNLQRERRELARCGRRSIDFYRIGPNSFGKRSFPGARTNETVLIVVSLSLIMSGNTSPRDEQIIFSIVFTSIVICHIK